jgi:hypothetical protein
MQDPIMQHFIELGARFSKLQGWAAIERCNCMIRYGDQNSQSPAIRRRSGKTARFFTPEGHELACPDSFEDMLSGDIIRLMQARGEEYIGHLFATES